MLTHRTHDRTTATALVRSVAAWDGAGLYVSGLHAGDLGWALRLPDEDLVGTLHGWWEGTDLAAAAIVSGDASARTRIAPCRAADATVVAAVTELVDSLTAPERWVDADPGTLLRQHLTVAGWDLDPDPWLALYRDLRTGPATTPVRDASTSVRRAADDVAGRVTAQRNGFEGSTFEEASWRRMAAGPGYHPGLDLVAVTDDGHAAAVATAWLSVPGGTALLEPVATHRAIRRAGWGRAVVEAACAAAQDAGASGMSVSTPASNEAAVAAYRAAGFRPVETVQALTRGRP